jgi:UDP-N-acetylglucosamine transferase subunit ALG13
MGLLSRFAPSKSTDTVVQTTNDPTPPLSFQYCFLLSGPEPQRTLLENIILKNTEGLKEPMVLVRGLPSSQNISTDTSKHTEKPISPNPLPASLPQQLTVYPHLPATELEQIILSSEWIICRSGYSTLMDLAALNKKAILIPTPGQTEQEYLAKQLSAKGMAFTVAQSKFSLSESIAKAKKISADARASKELPFFNTKILEGLLLAIESL